MDIDKMLIELRGLMEFKAKILALFPHGEIPEPRFVADGELEPINPGEDETHRSSAPATAIASAELLSRVDQALEFGKRLERLLPTLEKVIEDVEDMKLHHTEMAEGISALQQAEGKEAAPSQ